MVKEQKDFVCPDLSIIDKKGKELKLRDDTIEKAKDFATKYFEKTYLTPKYSSPKYLMPAFLYIAAIHGGYKYEGERKTQKEIAEAFNISIYMIYKWYTHIADTIDVDIEDDV